MGELFILGVMIAFCVILTKELIYPAIQDIRSIRRKELSSPLLYPGNGNYLPLSLRFIAANIEYALVAEEDFDYADPVQADTAGKKYRKVLNKYGLFPEAMVEYQKFFTNHDALNLFYFAEMAGIARREGLWPVHGGEYCLCPECYNEVVHVEEMIEKYGQYSQSQDEEKLLEFWNINLPAGKKTAYTQNTCAVNAGKYGSLYLHFTSEREVCLIKETVFDDDIKDISDLAHTVFGPVYAPVYVAPDTRPDVWGVQRRVIDGEQNE